MWIFYTNKILLPDSMNKVALNIPILVQAYQKQKKAIHWKEVKPNELPF